MAAIRKYEMNLSHALIEGLNSFSGLRIRGITNLNQLDQRVPTVSFTLEGWHPRQLAKALDEENIYVWDGNYYALAVTERLELEDKGGMLRVGAVHYNTTSEVEQLVAVLKKLKA